MLRNALVALSLSAGFAMAEARTYELDKAHTTIGFTVVHMSVSEVPGSFKDYAATITWDEKNPAASKIEATVQATSVDTAQAKRDEHLRAADFFDVAKTPELKFRSTSITAAAAGTYNVSGALTMRGITKNVTFTATVTPEVEHPMNKSLVRGLQGSFTVNRKDFKLGEKLPALLVGAEVKVKISVEMFRKP